MAEDADWLKKNPVVNPFRMNLRRSSKFYAQDMDGSIMTSEGVDKNKILAVCHMPRKSNIPMERIKEMNFRIPAPVGKKNIAKKPVSQISKFHGAQPSFPCSSASFKPALNKSGLKAAPVNAVRQRQSMFYRPVTQKNRTINESISCLSSVKKKPADGACESFNQSVIQGQSDVSLLSQSKIVKHSTPNELAVRSILVQKGNTRNHGQKLIDNNKPKAVKRVNFNGDVKFGTEMEKENQSVQENKSVESAEPLENVEDIKKGFNNDDDETTEAFGKCFKPISYKENVCQKNGEGDEERETERDEGDVKDGAVSVIRGVMDVWKLYNSKTNSIRCQLKSLDQNFKKSLNFMTTSDIRERLSAFEMEKCKLYEELQNVEKDFRENVKNSVDIKALFIQYTEKKEMILKSQSDLEERFEQSLQLLTKKHLGEEGVAVGEAKEQECVDVQSMSAKRDLKLKLGRRYSAGRRNSGINGSAKALNKLNRSSRVKLSTPRKRNSEELGADSEATPDNTPARRKRLSRKIQKQLKALFEE